MSFVVVDNHDREFTLECDYVVSSAFRGMVVNVGVQRMLYHPFVTFDLHNRIETLRWIERGGK